MQNIKHQINKDALTFETVISNIKNNICFSFARYGDGEWNAVYGKIGNNCDRHNYYPDMGRKLKNILLSSPKYYMGLQSLAIKIRGDILFDEYDIDWVDSDIFHHASIDGQMNKFFEAINDNVNKIIMIAPAYLQSIKKIMKYDTFIVVPELNCWLKHDSILKQIKNVIKKNNIVLFSSSMMTNVLIDELYNENVTLLDMGSVFDPYVNKLTRKYHKNLKINKN